MSPSREFNADNVEKAVSRAASNAGIPESEVVYEVLDTGSEGFLGIGARDARILVTLPPEPDLAEDETPEPSAVEEAEENDIPITRASDYEDEDDPGAVDEPEEADRLEAEYRSDRLEAGSSGPPHESLPDASPESLEAVRLHVEEVVEAMDIRSRVDVYDMGEHIAVDISSDHTALLIGQKGETIDALQHLINSATFHRDGSSKRVVLDSEGYRQRRIEALQGMAHRSARKAQRESREIKMPPMSSAERRVIHLFLEDNESVTTYSEGRGSDRRVVISPE